MGTGSRAQLLLGVSLLSLGAQAAWPVKTIDLTNNGDDCEYAWYEYSSRTRLFHTASRSPLIQLDGLCTDVVRLKNLEACLSKRKITFFVNHLVYVIGSGVAGYLCSGYPWPPYPERTISGPSTQL